MGDGISKISTEINHALKRAAGILGVGEKLLASLSKFFITFTEALVDISETLLPDLLDMAVVGTKLSLRVIEMLEKMFTNSLKFAERLEAHSSEIVDVGLHTLMTYASNKNYNEIYVLAIMEFLNHEMDNLFNKVIVNLFKNNNTADMVIEIKDISIIYWGSVLISNRLGLKLGKTFLVKLILEVLLRRIFVFGKRTMPKRRKIINTDIIEANKLVDEIKVLLNNKIRTKEEFLALEVIYKKLNNLITYHSKNMTIDINKEFAKIKVSYETAKKLFGSEISKKLSDAIELFYVKQRQLRIDINLYTRFKRVGLPDQIDKTYNDMLKIVEDNYDSVSLPQSLISDWEKIKNEYDIFKESTAYKGTNQSLYNKVKKMIDDTIQNQAQYNDMMHLFMLLSNKMLGGSGSASLSINFAALQIKVKKIMNSGKWLSVPGQPVL